MVLLSIQTIDRAHVTLKVTAIIKRNWFDKKIRGLKDREINYIGSGKDWTYESTGFEASDIEAEWLKARWDQWQWKRTNGLHFSA